MIGKNMATNASHLSVTVAEVKTALQSARERSKFRESESTRSKHRERTVVGSRWFKTWHSDEDTDELMRTKMAELDATESDNVTTVGHEDIKQRVC